MMKLKHETGLEVSELSHFLTVQFQDINTIYDQGAAVWSGQGSEYLKKCRLSCTGRSHNGHHLRLGNTEINTFEHLQGAKRFFYTFCLYHNGRAIFTSVKVTDFIRLSKMQNKKKATT